MVLPLGVRVFRSRRQVFCRLIKLISAYSCAEIDLSKQVKDQFLLDLFFLSMGVTVIL